MNKAEAPYFTKSINRDHAEGHPPQLLQTAYGPGPKARAGENDLEERHTAPKSDCLVKKRSLLRDQCQVTGVLLIIEADRGKKGTSGDLFHQGTQEVGEQAIEVPKG